MEYYIDINDEYEHLDESIEYVLENVLSEKCKCNNSDSAENLKELYNSVLITPCKDKSDCSECFHGGNYVLDSSSNELVLNYANKVDIIYECTPICSCDTTTCRNRLVQYGPRKHLQIVDSKIKSKGLITTVDVPRGAFICEYAGELLTSSEARQRLNDNEKNGCMNYILCLNEIILNRNTTVNKVIVDPSRIGNIGRYLNHSCNPNCEIYSVHISPIPKIGIFSKRQIFAGEELTFHYNGNMKPEIQGKKDIPCLCNSVNCEKFLPNHEF